MEAPVTTMETPDNHGSPGNNHGRPLVGRAKGSKTVKGCCGPRPCRYKNDPEILAMTNLIAAYQRNEILEFEKILKVGGQGGEGQDLSKHPPGEGKI